MNERERILELVKKGVLSTDEALDLLEEMGKKTNTETQDKHDAEEIQNFIDDEQTFKTNEEPKMDREAEDQKNLEEILDRLATESNQASAELDEVMVEIEGITLSLVAAREALMELNTKEELDGLEAEELVARQDLEEEVKELEVTLAELKEEKNNLEGQLKNIRRSQWSQKKEEFQQKMDIPEDWKEQANETFNQVGEKVVDVTNQMGKFLKKTFQSVSQSVGENVEWKDINFKIPGVATTKLEKEYLYEEVTATILDIQVANGHLKFKFWEKDEIKVESTIKLYGKMDAATPLEAFEERSQIDLSHERFMFKVPNKRVRVDATFYLPARTYDYAAFKLLNGDISIQDFDVKDIYVKSTNGDIELTGLRASMLEVSGVNGNVQVLSGSIIDAIIDSVNGSVRMQTVPENLSVSLVNGDIRLTLKEDHLRRLKANTVNGDVKIALPVTQGIEGIAKSSLGSIQNRLTDFEVVREKKERMNQLLQFRRVTDEVAKIDLSTTTGNIYLKNSEA
ncbi:daptomycin-sensing surface protein LiaX [Enterococcus sp. LJL98]